MPVDSSSMPETPAEAASDGRGALGGELYPRRKALADRYFKDHLRDQRGWYSKESGKAKRRTVRIAFLVLACGAGVTLLQTLDGELAIPWLGMTVDIRIATALLGAVIVLAEGWERINKFHETWLGYRKASEGMQREYRLFINNAGDYSGAAGDDEAYRWFVEAVEKVIAEEQSQFWEARGRKSEQEAPGEEDT